MLIILSPIIALIAIAIFLDDGFPVFFKQKRVGKQNKYFWIYKFRTMSKNTPDIPTHLLKNPSSRYTKIGPILRKYSIDELPQLFNILRGDIGFIGPRPALHNQYDLIKMRTDQGIESILPGITGWAQVNGRDEIDITDKVNFDLYYLKNKNIMLDIKIMYLTLFKVFKAEDVVV